jgi:hypothetical protein
MEEDSVIQCSNRTDGHTLSAEFTVQRAVEVGTDLGLDAPPDKGDLIGSHHFIADPDAHTAEDAPIHVSFDERRNVVGGAIRFGTPKGIIGDAILIDEILQLTLTASVAHRAFKGMGHENQLKLGPPGFDHFRGVGQYLHPVTHRIETCRDKSPPALLLNHTDPAGSEGHEPLVFTESGNLDPGLGCCVHDHRSRRNRNLDPIDCQSDRFLLFVCHQ